MKKLFYSFIFLTLFSPSVVFAGACPMLAGDIEDKISKFPDHYFWFHRKWKSTIS